MSSDSSQTNSYDTSEVEYLEFVDVTDSFSFNDQVGDIVNIHIEVMQPFNFSYMALAFITSILPEGDHFRVCLQRVSEPQLTWSLSVEEHSPYNVRCPDQGNKSKQKATKADILARREALYESEIAAMTLSTNFLKTRNRAYKR